MAEEIFRAELNCPRTDASRRSEAASVVESNAIRRSAVEVVLPVVPGAPRWNTPRAARVARKGPDPARGGV